MLRRFVHEAFGTAMVEALIALPLVVSLLAGGIEFGRLFSAYATADKSMRDAARYLAKVPETGVCTWGLANAKNLAMYGVISPQDARPLIDGWTDPETISLSSPACNSFGNAAVLRLSASVPFQLSLMSVIGLSNKYTFSVWHEERHIGL